MATKYQTELTLKALLLEMHRTGQDLYAIADEAILRMHQDKLFVKEDSLRERGGAEDALLVSIKEIAGSKQDVELGSIEDF
ncbi:hypothetical protein [Pantoea anthophila]|uniref:hypothetical protein n=1 Tax=Pantoea anthophila TaxID=470931 RepID=UPI0027804807|nr:hypothetical protein [Pantoea anthophila]MDQ1213555.1 sulfur relay (sulfurtransferase) DsrF/TusC family protein [Pantoea anthophila]